MGESSFGVARFLLLDRVVISLALRTILITVFMYELQHSDVSFEPFPSSYAILKLNNIPETGGDTVRSLSHLMLFPALSLLTQISRPLSLLLLLGLGKCLRSLRSAFPGSPTVPLWALRNTRRRTLFRSRQSIPISSRSPRERRPGSQGCSPSDPNEPCNWMARTVSFLLLEICDASLFGSTYPVYLRSRLCSQIRQPSVSLCLFLHYVALTLCCSN